MAAKALLLSNPATVTSSDALSSEIQFTESLLQYGLYTKATTATIIVDSGSIQFNIGRAVVASSATYVAGDKIILTFVNGAFNIFYKADLAARVFRISV